MSTYLLRRLLVMIPTLLGVTIVSFCIMQLAPGDPLLSKAGAGGGRSTQTREAYLIQKRDLKLDKPLVLNFNWFRDYAEDVRLASHYMAMSDVRIAEDLPRLADGGDDESIARRRFLERLRVPDLARRLADPEQHAALAQAIQSYVQVFCENTASYGVPAAVELLRTGEGISGGLSRFSFDENGTVPFGSATVIHSPVLRRSDVDLQERIGAIRCLANMAPDPFTYTYSRTPTDAQTPYVVATWRTWWERVGRTLPAPSASRRAALERQLADLAAEPSRTKLMEGARQFRLEDAPVLAGRLLGQSTLQEKVVAAMGLRLTVATPLAADVSRDARPPTVEEVAQNWLDWFDSHRAEFEPGTLKKTWYVVADTQYAYMVWRLVTFDFGRSAVKTREPVSGKIWSAVLVSAPLMILSELIIYLVAVPLGILCAVNRNGWVDRSLSLGLFVLYSVPPFVAGMLFLLFFCYGDYLQWFPKLGLHAMDAERLGPIAYALDYLHHICLPVVCLSLFSLAGMAMYSRSSMLDVIGQDYIRTARAKGLSETKVIFKHAFRNALIPIITLFSSFLPAMLGGSVLIEVLFGIPGMGRLNFESILLKDFPTLMAMFYVEAILVMLSILMTDLLYVVVDPRISLESQGQST